MKKDTLFLITKNFDSMIKHMMTMANYVITDEKDKKIIIMSYERLKESMENLANSASNPIEDTEIKFFLLFLKTEMSDFIEQLDILYYKSINKFRLYDSEVREIKTTLGKMKIEIEEQVNEMGEMLLDHQKSIENLYTNQSLMIGLTSSTPLELETAEDNTEETKIEDIID